MGVGGEEMDGDGHWVWGNEEAVGVSGGLREVVRGSILSEVYGEADCWLFSSLSGKYELESYLDLHHGAAQIDLLRARLSAEEDGTGAAIA
jgi:hypothetical protein